MGLRWPQTAGESANSRHVPRRVAWERRRAPGGPQLHTGHVRNLRRGHDGVLSTPISRLSKSIGVVAAGVVATVFLSQNHQDSGSRKIELSLKGTAVL